MLNDLLQRHRSMSGIVLLVICGALWGAIPMLSKLAAQMESHPIGLSLLINSIGAAACLLIYAPRGTLRLPTLPQLKFYLAWAVLYSVLNQVLVYWLAAKLNASLVSIFSMLEGICVFAGAAMIRLEKPCITRCLGLVAGLAGSILLLGASRVDGAPIAIGLLAAGMLIPITYAMESIYIAARQPADVPPLAAVTWVMVFSIPYLAALAWWNDDFVKLSMLPGTTGLIAAAMAAATIIANMAYVLLVRVAGAVFAGQLSYVMALSGIGWSVTILGEHLAMGMIFAAGLIIAGMFLVKPSAQHIEIQNVS